MGACLPSLRRRLSGSSQADCPAFSTFSLLWAVAALLHFIWTDILVHRAPFTTAGPLFAIVLALSAAAVIHRPSSVRRLLVLSVIQIIEAGYWLPFVPNHWLLTGFVNLTIVCAAVQVKSRGWSTPLRASALYRTFVPCVRLEVIIFYFFTFFHKLNADFLDPASSCAVTFLGHITDLFSLPSLPLLESVVIFGTLGVELALCIGLALPRLWLPAVLLGAGFHFLLALDLLKVFYNFSAVMYALLWVFIPPAVASHLSRLPQQLVRRTRGKPIRAGLIWLCFNRFHFLGGYLLTLVLCWQYPELSLPLNILGFALLWLVWAATLFVSLGPAWRSLRERGGERLSLRAFKRSALLLIPCLVFLNGLGPYLGLKLRSAWQMYSNLNISHSSSNHFLIPASLDVGGFLADSVIITSTSDSRLDTRYVQTHAGMTYFELQFYLAHHPEVRIAYIRSGQYQAVARAGNSPEFSAPSHPILRKLLVFRPLGPQAGKICDW